MFRGNRSTGIWYPAGNNGLILFLGFFSDLIIKRAVLCPNILDCQGLVRFPNALSRSNQIIFFAVSDCISIIWTMFLSDFSAHNFFPFSHSRIDCSVIYKYLPLTIKTFKETFLSTDLRQRPEFSEPIVCFACYFELDCQLGSKPKVFS